MSSRSRSYTWMRRPQLKRFAARAKGRGARIIKRNSHITVEVSDGKKD